MSAEQDGALESLVEFIRDHRGFDFTGYKRPSLARRVSKRMADVKVPDYAAYRTYLESHEDEFGALFDTILINVTGFFRDTPIWSYVAGEIVPRIVDQREALDIRVWSTGCSTGEEAYTAAMIFAEALGEDEFRKRVKIYATDVDEAALARGRHASFSPRQLDPVPPDLRDRYFEAIDDRFVFRADLRRTVIFGRHDLVQDPPISRIDLLLSRNTLIYFDSAAQTRILNNFHFALRNGGFLVLGKAENLVARNPLFTPVDVKRRVFTKVDARAHAAPVLPRERPEAEALEDELGSAGFEIAPVGQLIVDTQGRLAQANLQARLLFGLASRDIGRPIQDLELSYRPIELRSRIEQVAAERHVINVRDVEWRVHDDAKYFDVQVTPLVAATGESLGVVVTFTDVSRYRRLQEALEQTKREMETAYEELQSTVEELETTNEELQSTNEELETTNEELQSTNEELETMNEELQSTNEELETMNDELGQRTDDLNETNAFLESVLGSINAGIAVVDRDLRVEAWNDRARLLWGLDARDVSGQHFLNLDIGLPVEQLSRPLRRAIGGEELELVLPAVNRRGRQIECTVRIAPLNGREGDPRGAIVLMDGEDGAAPKE